MGRNHLFKTFLLVTDLLTVISRLLFAVTDKESHGIVKREAVEKKQTIWETDREKPKGRSKKSFNAVSTFYRP